MTAEHDDPLEQGGAESRLPLEHWARILVCPACRGRLEPLSGAPQDLLCCETCRLAYPVVDGVPYMISEEARPYPTR